MAAGNSNFTVRDAGTHKPVRPYVRDAGTWKEASEVWVRDAGTWKKSYIKSDPFSRELNCTDSDSYRTSGWVGDKYVRQASAGTGDFLGAMAFDYGVIQSDLAIRPNVTSAFLRLTRLNDGHGYNPANGVRVWGMDRTDVTAGFALTKVGQPDLGGNYTWPTPIYRGNTVMVPIPTSLVTGMGHTGPGYFPFPYGGLAIAEDESLNPGTGAPLDDRYMVFEKFDSSTTVRPRLFYTCDY